MISLFERILQVRELLPKYHIACMYNTEESLLKNDYKAVTEIATVEALDIHTTPELKGCNLNVVNMAVRHPQHGTQTIMMIVSMVVEPVVIYCALTTPDAGEMIESLSFCVFDDDTPHPLNVGGNHVQQNSKENQMQEDTASIWSM